MAQNLLMFINGDRDYDDDAACIRIRPSTKPGKVYLAVDTPELELDPSQARRIATHLIEHAADVDKGANKTLAAHLAEHKAEQAPYAYQDIPGPLDRGEDPTPDDPARNCALGCPLEPGHPGHCIDTDPDTVDP